MGSLSEQVVLGSSSQPHYSCAAEPWQVGGTDAEAEPCLQVLLPAFPSQGAQHSGWGSCGEQLRH